MTPVAIKAGVRLAHRIFGDDGKPKLKMNYDLVPTTVFTPLEYGCVGMSEELAKEACEENIESFLSYFKPLEWTVNHAAHDNGNMHREDNACFAKVVVNKADSDRVVGLHYLGPNAGEVTQGYNGGDENEHDETRFGRYGWDSPDGLRTVHDHVHYA